MAQIQRFIEQPERKNEYEQFLNQIANHALEKEYQTNFFIINWFNKLLRYLKIKPQSPLHPHINKLACMINSESQQIVPNESLEWLPPKEDMMVYNDALSALADGNNDLFWSSISLEDKKGIIKQPLRFNELLRLLAQYAITPMAFFALVDKDSLLFFNTPKGLRQLILETPAFDNERDMPLLATILQKQGIILECIPDIVDLLLAEECVFQALVPLFPAKSKNYDDLLVQEHILNTLPKPLQKDPLERFLSVYCTDAHHFSELMLSINNSNSSLVHQLWNTISPSRWNQWYGDLEHANEWEQTLHHLELSDRLEFFEKLTSDGKLTAEEFCDFLLQKNSAVFKALWEKIPAAQWTTWLTDNPKLPKTTLSFLNSSPFPLRIALLQAMLGMSLNDLSTFCIATDITLEQYYHEEVVHIMQKATTVSDAKAKLNKLKQNTHEDLDNKITNLIETISQLLVHLQELKKINPMEHSSSYFSMFSANPIDKLLTLINEVIKKITKSAELLSANPLRQILNNQETNKPILVSFMQIEEVFNETLEHLTQNQKAQHRLQEEQNKIPNIQQLLKLLVVKDAVTSEVHSSCS